LHSLQGFQEVGTYVLPEWLRDFSS